MIESLLLLPVLQLFKNFLSTKSFVNLPRIRRILNERMSNRSSLEVKSILKEMLELDLIETKISKKSGNTLYRMTQEGEKELIQLERGVDLE